MDRRAPDAGRGRATSWSATAPALQQTTEKLKQALAVLAQRKSEADKRVAEYRDMLVRFKDLIDAGTLSVRIVDGRMVLALPTDVLFDSGSARLSKTGKEAVQQVGAVLRRWAAGGSRSRATPTTCRSTIRSSRRTGSSRPPARWSSCAR